ncbi:MAG: LON peptidase substrate-binding domain-containing protein, partial [Nitrospirales bacterium]
MADEPVVTTLPILPIKRTVLYPAVAIPLTIGRAKSAAAVDAALKTEEKTVVVVTQRDPEQEEPSLEDLYTIGTKAVIKQVARMAEGQVHVLVQGIERVVLLKLERHEPFLLVRARQLPSLTGSGPEFDALDRAIRDLVNELPSLIQSPGLKEAILALTAERDPVALAYRVGSLLNLTIEREQKLLESP